MKTARLLACAAALGLMLTGGSLAAGITGAGSTFIYPVFAKWADTYKAETGIGLNYQSIGSGGGIKQVEAGTVTFGATDKPLSDDELTKNGLVQFPIVMGGIVPIINLKGVAPGALVLDAPTLAGIYLGNITRWDDPAIAALNSGLALPSAPIVVVHRSDGSGTTFNFTDFLGKGSPEWADRIGSDTAVEWPAGIGAKGSEGVANTVKQTANSIGYVEYAYAAQNGLSYAGMKNAAGKVVAPSLTSFAAAAANADWANARNFNLVITNQPGEASWPIAASTWVLIHAQPKDPAAAGAALAFFDWTYTKGRDLAEALDYVAIPDSVVARIEASWSAITADGKPVFAKR